MSARQRYDHYIALAEAAEKAGDRVQSEFHYQYADHYYRILHEAKSKARAGKGAVRA